MTHDDRARLIHEYYQVASTAKYPWRGIPLDKSVEKSIREKRKKRPIELNPSDILIKSCNGKYYNRINRVGAVNIEIPEKDLIKRTDTIFFGETLYNQGISPED